MEVKEVGKKLGKLMMRWFSGELFDDTESIGASFAIFFIPSLVFIFSSGHLIDLRSNSFSLLDNL